MSDPRADDLTACANCRYGEHGRCAQRMRDHVTCTCRNDGCVAWRAKWAPATEAAEAARKKQRNPVSPLSSGMSVRDERTERHEQTEVVSVREGPDPALCCPHAGCERHARPFARKGYLAQHIRLKHEAATKGDEPGKGAPVVKALAEVEEPSDEDLALVELAEQLTLPDELLPREPTTCVLSEADIAAGRDDDCTLHDHELEPAPLLAPPMSVPVAELLANPGEWVDVGVVELRWFPLGDRMVVRARIAPDDEAA